MTTRANHLYNLKPFNLHVCLWPYTRPEFSGCQNWSMGETGPEVKGTCGAIDGGSPRSKSNRVFLRYVHVTYKLHVEQSPQRL